MTLRAGECCRLDADCLTLKKRLDEIGRASSHRKEGSTDRVLASTPKRGEFGSKESG